jgi:hypothetical protein
MIRTWWIQFGLRLPNNAWSLKQVTKVSQTEHYRYRYRQAQTDGLTERGCIAILHNRNGSIDSPLVQQVANHQGVTAGTSNALNNVTGAPMFMRKL